MHLKRLKVMGFFSWLTHLNVFTLTKYIFVIIYRNEAYFARTLVAVMDHNNNLNRKPSLSSSGDPMYQKVYSKRSKNLESPSCQRRQVI